jgi:molybdopterin adenylyltransferase
MFKVGIITASDKGSRGERVDQSGQVIREMVPEINGEVVVYQMVPDEFDQLRDAMIKQADIDQVDLIITTGGTGLSLRDVTPEATKAVIDREVPGIAEVMRMESLKKTNRAMLTRGIAGTRKQTLIINLPGSPKAVRECLEVIFPALPHGLQILKGEASECGTDG